MNKIFITGLLALAATTASLSSAEARPGDRGRNNWQNRNWQNRGRQVDNRRDAYADRIENAFNRDSVLRRFDLDSDNRGRNIEIEGRVNTRDQRIRAYNLATRTAPGFRIINKIVVR
jgi:hypothetical protein